MTNRFFLVQIFIFNFFFGAVENPLLMYYVQPGTPISLQNFVKLEDGCNWMGIGGQIFDQTGKPITGLIVSISGTLEEIPLLQYTITGSNSQLGPGGYLLSLADHPIFSEGSIAIQVLDGEGTPLIAPISLSTNSNCEENFILMNFSQLPVSIRFYFPLVFKS